MCYIPPFLLMILFLVISQTVQASTLKIAIGTGHAISTQLYRDLVSEAYKRAGLSVEYIAAPVFRSVDLVRDGQAVAVAVRVEDLIIEQAKLEKIPVVIGSINIAVLSVAPLQKRLTKHSLVNKRVGSLKGFSFLTSYMPFQKFIWMTNLEALVKKLVSGQLDYIVYMPNIFEKAAKQWYPEKEFFVKSLVKRNVFHYVSKNNINLKQPLTAAFQSMVDDGYIMKKADVYGYKVEDWFLRRVQ